MESWETSNIGSDFRLSVGSFFSLDRGLGSSTSCDRNSNQHSFGGIDRRTKPNCKTAQTAQTETKTGPVTNNS